jgi:hypothetical protein
MKKLIFILILLKCFDVNAQVVEGTLHKTENGKYPFYFNDNGQEEWTEALQKNYDDKMGSTLKQLCQDSASLGELEKEYIQADQKNGNNLNSHPEIGNKIQALKTEMTKLSNIVVQGTGQSARVWGCQWK